MGSRVMHAIIAYKVAEALQLEEKTAFLLGGIAADATNDKDRSHFYIGEQAQFTRQIHYDGFHQKYAKQQDAYILGYYSHLIADEFWLNGFYVPWLKHCIEANPATLQQYHQDFRRLNAKLAAHYHIKDALTALLEQPCVVPSIDEVQAADVYALASAVQADLQGTDDEPLDIFTLPQIIGYIETSVAKSIYCIRQLS